MNNNLRLFTEDQFKFLSNRLDDCRKYIDFKNGETRRLNSRDGRKRKILDWDLIKNNVKQSLMEG